MRRRLQRMRTPARASSDPAPIRTDVSRRGLFGLRASRAHAYASGESLPYATIALVAAGCACWVLVRGGYLGSIQVAGVGSVSGRYVSFLQIAIGGPLNGSWWKLLTSAFAYVDGLYAFLALLATAIFGWLLERRRGPVIVLAVFFGGSVTGALVADAVYSEPIVSGAGAGALALIGVWSVPDLLAARRGRYYEGDLLGVLAIAATLLLAPYARPEVSWLANVVGVLAGLILGLGIHLIEDPER